MLQRLQEDLFDMRVIQGIEDRLALLAAFDDPRVSERAQLVGDRRLPHFQEYGQVVHAQFFLQQGGNDANPGRIAEGFEVSDK